MRFRHEQPNGHRIVEEVIREAFWNLYRPGANEHYLVHTLRKHPDFMPELSFVIELDGRLVGSIYDATFPEKEKRVLPCRMEFAKASTEIDARISF